jgi:hypothetical protein
VPSLPTTLLLTACLPALCAQDRPVSLRARLPDLLAHIHLPGGQDAGSRLLRRLVADPQLGACLAGSDAQDPLLAAVVVLQDVLARSTGEVELALTALQPRTTGCMPLVLFRSRLDAELRERVQALIARGAVVRPGRELEGRQIHELALPAAGTEQPLDQVGRTVELLLDGDDLLLSNSTTAMADWVRGAGSQPPAEPPSTGPAAATLFVDWARIAPRLAGRTNAAPWPPTFGELLLGWSGLASARDATVTFQPSDRGLRVAVRIGLGTDRRPAGWLAGATPADPAAISADMPAALDQGGTRSIASIAIALDPKSLFRPPPGPRSGRLHSMCDRLAGDLGRLGLDFDAQVLARLGPRAGVQLAVVAGKGSLRPMFLLQARTPRAAQQLLADLHLRLERLSMVVAHPVAAAKGVSTPVGTLHGGAASSTELLHARVPGLGEVHLAAIGSQLVCSPDAELITALRAAGPAGERAVPAGVLRELPAGERVGVIALDLRPLARGDEAPALFTRYAGTASLRDGALLLDLLAPSIR